jgi:hypothetical protein
VCYKPCAPTPPDPHPHKPAMPAPRSTCMMHSRPPTLNTQHTHKHTQRTPRRGHGAHSRRAGQLTGARTFRPWAVLALTAAHHCRTRMQRVRLPWPARVPSRRGSAACLSFIRNREARARHAFDKVAPPAYPTPPPGVRACTHVQTSCARATCDLMPAAFPAPCTLVGWRRFPSEARPRR